MLEPWLIEELKRLEKEKLEKQQKDNRLYIEIDDYEEEKKKEDIEQNPTEPFRFIGKNEIVCWPNERQEKDNKRKNYSL